MIGKRKQHTAAFKAQVALAAVEPVLRAGGRDGGEPAAATLRVPGLIDEEYTAHPFLGSRRMTAWLIRQGEPVNRKRVQRLLRLMGLEAIYPKPRLSVAGRG